MSYPPPSDPLQPYDPTRAFGTPPTGHPVSGEPYASATGDQQTPGSPPWASPPAPPGYPPHQPGYPPPTAHQPPVGPGYPPYQPGNPPAHPGPAPKRSVAPLVAVIIAVTLLLCGGTAVAGTLIVRNITNRAKEAAQSLPPVPTALPDLPNVPTDVPDIPGLPTDSNGQPALPGLTDKTVTVVYEVTGDGPADITYVEKISKSPKRVKKAKLPWRKEISMTGATFVSVVAFRTGAGSGAISCSTTVDGEQVAQGAKDGAFAVASCSKFIY